MRHFNADIILFIIVFIIGAALSLGYGYLIATSNLPDWLKFYLLK